jgi:hypothetical protein
MSAAIAWRGGQTPKLEKQQLGCRAIPHSIGRDRHNLKRRALLKYMLPIGR